MADQPPRPGGQPPRKFPRARKSVPRVIPRPYVPQEDEISRWEDNDEIIPEDEDEEDEEDVIIIQDDEKEEEGAGASSHAYSHDERNDNVLVGLRTYFPGELEKAKREGGKEKLSQLHQMKIVEKSKASVSILESGFMLGDGVWEGLRLHDSGNVDPSGQSIGVIGSFDEHLKRLYEGCLAIDMKIDVSKEEMKRLVYQVVDENKMVDGVHIRLMVTRGLKPTPFQSPYITLSPPTIVILPEYKNPLPTLMKTGLKLFTVHTRRGLPDTQDPMINSIQGCIQAHYAGADEGLMLDVNGFVSTCNSTNFFCVRDGCVWAPTTKYQIHGVTRANVIKCCIENGIRVRELDFSLAEVYSADECFVTGTFSGMIPVRTVDGRNIGETLPGPMTSKISKLFKQFINNKCSQGR